MAAVVERSWSPEVRILRRPRRTCEELASVETGGRWGGRVWLLAFVLGCFVSGVASGRLTPRLVIDGAMSFAFIPAIELAALAVVRRRNDVARGSFRSLVDRFLVGNAPWLCWLAAAMFVASAVPPRRIYFWFWPLAATALVPVGWSMVIDFQFFRRVMGRDRRGAIAGVVLFRAVAWTLAIAYFFGVAIWADLGI